MKVLALDPGDRIGWARVDMADNGDWTELRHGITELKPMAFKVDKTVRSGAYDLVICEEWRLYSHMAKHMVGSEIPSAQFIGMVKLACWSSGVPLVMQSARLVNSNRPGVLSPAEASMKRLRPETFDLVMQPGAHDDLHDMVAIKHLWAYTFRHFPIEVTPR